MDGAAYHTLAKDAGNRLKGYIIGYSSGATGVLFLALADVQAEFSSWQKGCIAAAIVFFVLTTLLCLFELHVDARRFFYVAKQIELPESEQSWQKNERYKATRVRLIYSSYITLTIATLASVAFLLTRLT